MGSPRELRPKGTGWREGVRIRDVGLVFHHGDITVISSLVDAEYPDGNGTGPQWHVSLSFKGKRPKEHHVRRALRAFGMVGAEEDNHHPGVARHFWRPVDPTRRVDCQCKEDEDVIVEPDGYTWTNPNDGSPCRGCELQKLLPHRRCPLHDERKVTHGTGGESPPPGDTGLHASSVSLRRNPTPIGAARRGGTGRSSTLKGPIMKQQLEFLPETKAADNIAIIWADLKHVLHRAESDDDHDPVQVFVLTQAQACRRQVSAIVGHHIDQVVKGNVHTAPMFRPDYTGPVVALVDDALALIDCAEELEHQAEGRRQALERGEGDAFAEGLAQGLREETPAG